MKKLAFSGMVMAAYIVLTVGLAPISFGPIQIRFSTGLYALAYHYPFLVLPLALANSMSNWFGGLGPWDVVGGFVAGLFCTWAITKIKHPLLALIPIYTIVPLVVSSYLSGIFGLPFWVLVIQIAAGQFIAAHAVGLVVINAGIFRRSRAS